MQLRPPTPAELDELQGSVQGGLRPPTASEFAEIYGVQAKKPGRVFNVQKVKPYSVLEGAGDVLRGFQPLVDVVQGALSAGGQLAGGVLKMINQGGPQLVENIVKAGDYPPPPDPNAKPEGLPQLKDLSKSVGQVIRNVVDVPSIERAMSEPGPLDVLMPQPTTEGGKRWFETFNSPLEGAGLLADKMAKLATNDPQKQAGIRQVANLGIMALMGKAVHMAGSAMKTSPVNAPLALSDLKKVANMSEAGWDSIENDLPALNARLREMMATSARTPDSIRAEIAQTMSDIQKNPKYGVLDQPGALVRVGGETGGETPVDTGWSSAPVPPGMLPLPDGSVAKFDTRGERAKALTVYYRMGGKTPDITNVEPPRTTPESIYTSSKTALPASRTGDLGEAATTLPTTSEMGAEEAIVRPSDRAAIDLALRGIEDKLAADPRAKLTPGEWDILNKSKMGEQIAGNVRKEVNPLAVQELKRSIAEAIKPVEDRPEDLAAVEEFAARPENKIPGDVLGLKVGGTVEYFDRAGNRIDRWGNRIQEDKAAWGGLPMRQAVESQDRRYKSDPTVPEEAIRTSNTAISDLTSAREKRFIPGLRVVDNLQHMGGPTAELATAARNYVKEHAQTSAPAILRAKDAFLQVSKSLGMNEIKTKLFPSGGASRNIMHRLVDLVEGKDKPRNILEAQAVDTVRKIHADIAKRAQAVGVRTRKFGGGEAEFAGLGEEYFPVEYEDARGFINDLQKPEFRKMRDIALNDIAARHFPDELTKNPDVARERANNLLKVMRTDNASSRFGHLESQRILTEDAVARIRAIWETNYPKEKFPLERKYSLSSWVDYLDGANDRISWLKNFGPDVYDRGWALPEKVRDAVSKIGNDDNRRYVEKFFSSSFKPTTSGASRAMGLIRSANTLKMLWSGVPNATQFFTNTLPELSVADIIKTIPKDIASAFDRQFREWFANTGASPHAEVKRVLSAEDRNILGQISGAFLRINQFESTEAHNARFSALGGREKAIRLMDQLHNNQGKGWRDPARLAELKRLGIDEATARKAIDGKLMEPDAMRALADTAYYMRVLTQFSGSPFYRPASWSTPLGKTATQFKGFAYNQSFLVGGWVSDFMKALQPVKTVEGKTKFWLGREGDVSKLMKGAITLPLAGYAISKVKDLLYPMAGLTPPGDLVEGKSLPMKWLLYSVQAGGLGLMLDAINQIQRGYKGIVSLIGGPTISQVADGLYSAGRLMAGNSTLGKEAATLAGNINPSTKSIMASVSPEYKKAMTDAQWKYLKSDLRKNYLSIATSAGEDAADQYWEAATKNTRYQYLSKIYGDAPKPTFAETRRAERKKERE